MSYMGPAGVVLTPEDAELVSKSLKVLLPDSRLAPIIRRLDRYIEDSQDAAEQEA